MTHAQTQTIRRILLTGGGTAGHVNPALAIGAALGSADTRFLFVGVRGRVEEEVVPREGIPIKYVRASGFPGGISAELIRFGLNLAVGIAQSLAILLRFRPEVIIGTGGYVAAPIVIAAYLLEKLRLGKSRVFIHEQNAVPGRLNRLMGRFAHKVLVTFPETLSHFPDNGVLVGYPLRRRIARVSREEASAKSSVTIPEGRRVILVFGGSQGSRTINRALVDALGYLIPYRDRIFIVHGVGLFKSADYNSATDTEARLRARYGPDQMREIEEFYTYRTFFHDIHHLYALSDLAVARAGAGSLNEISAMGLPALIIPKSNLPGDHQVMNARSMERAGGAEVLYEQISPIDGVLSEWIDGKLLAERLMSLALDDTRLERMREHSGAFLNRDALERIELLVRGAGAPEQAGAPATTGAPKHAPLPGNRALLAMLEKASAKQRKTYKPSALVARSQDLEYFKNRASGLLLHASWQERNVGIKLLGLLHAGERIPALLALFNDRTPASLLMRIMGGDFKQVGFIRRNIIMAFVRIGEPSPEIEEALLTGLKDPYYEVRAESARAAAFFAGRLSAPENLIPALLKLMTDRSIDVSVAAAEALGKIGGENDALPALLGMWDARPWKLRAAVLRGLLSLVERGAVSRLDLIEQQGPRFILTSTDFAPHFEIKNVYRLLMESVSRKTEKRIAQ